MPLPGKKPTSKDYHFKSKGPTSSKTEEPILETPGPGEQKVNWQDLEEWDQNIIAATFSKAIKYKKPDIMLRVLNLANPFLIMGKGYTRIAKESEEICKLLMTQYL